MLKNITKKNIKLIVFCFSLLMVFMFNGCTSKKNDTISKGTEAVIDTMLTCPNDELCPSNSIIGMGTEGLGEENQDNTASMENVLKNWEKKVGSYFAQGKLESFLNNGPGLSYLLESNNDNIQIKVTDKQLIDKTDTTETVKVTAEKEGKKFEVTYIFTFDSDGLIKRVTE
ncbi:MULTISPECIES: hypothetical protein [Oscillospiraceae]|uniref:hypothetical protein n=1 Tax=Oscillospiraceae TaxID=216572 RepID=UPI001105B557|nr:MULTISPECIES: hypothetical protein [Oscillospiraceae]